METKDYLTKIIYSYNDINNRIKELAKEINDYYKNKENILYVPIMDGSILFAANLLIEFDFNLHVRTTKISSYSDNLSSNKNPKLLIHIPMDLVKGKNILVVDDLVDSGHTLSMFLDYLKNMGANDVKLCALFKKDIKPREKEVYIDFLGFMIPNEWVAGYGIDSQGYFRNLKDFGIVNKKYIK